MRKTASAAVSTSVPLAPPVAALAVDAPGSAGRGSAPEWERGSIDAPSEDASDDASPAIDDPVSPAVRAVIELFATQLAKVAFPDIDAAALRRQADELRAEAAAVARARAALDAALASCATRTAALADTARRAVAYAQIYSEAHPERLDLATAIAALSEPAPVAAGAPAQGKRRGRPPRRSAELFDARSEAMEGGDPAGVVDSASPASTCA